MNFLEYKDGPMIWLHMTEHLKNGSGYINGMCVRDLLIEFSKTYAKSTMEFNSINKQFGIVRYEVLYRGRLFLLEFYYYGLVMDEWISKA